MKCLQSYVASIQPILFIELWLSNLKITSRLYFMLDDYILRLTQVFFPIFSYKVRSSHSFACDFPFWSSYRQFYQKYILRPNERDIITSERFKIWSWYCSNNMIWIQWRKMKSMMIVRICFGDVSLRFLWSIPIFWYCKIVRKWLRNRCMRVLFGRYL